MLRQTIILSAALLFATICGCSEENTAIVADGDIESIDNAATSEAETEKEEENLSDSGYHLNSDNTLTFFQNNRDLFTLTAIEAETFQPEVSMLFGQYDFEKHDESVSPLQISQQDGVLILSTRDARSGEIIVTHTPSDNLNLEIKLDSSLNAAAVKISFACGAADRFWGFGEQYNSIEFKGLEVPVWVSEQGVGRSPDPVLPFSGSLTDTYFPMPYFLDPASGKGLLLRNTEYAVFDLCQKDESSWTIEIWNGTGAELTIFPGPDAGQVIRQLAAEVGKPALPPDWAFSGVWLAAQGGTEAIAQRLQTALEAGIPVSALWVQDWVGLREFSTGQFGVKYHWLWDQYLYPELAATIADMKTKGVRFLGYFNPFVVPDLEHYDEMSNSGYLVRNSDGADYVFPIVSFNGGLIDLSNPEAVDYFKSFAEKALGLGMSGWMADFGEWLPFDAVLHEGKAPSTHNLYPTSWHRANLEVLEEVENADDLVLLTRSGFTGEQSIARIVWAGDQEASFDEYDGLPTVVTAGLTLGMAAVPFFTHDIAGFSGGPSTKELFLRWTELGAFTPVMRTHDGLKKLDNWRFDSDAETLAHFRFFARLHAALLPYFKALAIEAVNTGMPIIRHTGIVDSEWTEAMNAHRQWMIGTDLLFVPVTTEGADVIEVRFPSGEWEHLFTGESYAGRRVAQVEAPPGLPAVFVRSNSLTEITAAIHSLYAEWK